MDEFSDIWIEQCDAARDIRDAWGTRKALGYLIGEKLLNHIRAADSDPSWAAKLPSFAAEITRIFTKAKNLARTSRQPRGSDRSATSRPRSSIRRCSTPARSMMMWLAEPLTPSCLNERARCFSIAEHSANHCETAPSSNPTAFADESAI